MTAEVPVRYDDRDERLAARRQASAEGTARDALRRALEHAAGFEGAVRDRRARETGSHAEDRWLADDAEVREARGADWRVRAALAALDGDETVMAAWREVLLRERFDGMCRDTGAQ